MNLPFSPFVIDPGSFMIEFEKLVLNYKLKIESLKAKTTGNKSGQQKSNANWSSFQQKQNGPAPSSASAHAPRNIGECKNQSLQNFRARPAQSQGSVAQGVNGTHACAQCGTTHSRVCRDGSTRKRCT
ncbi:hypothetical protein H5410_052191 [Solanum commersonii]|uniref:Gag-pol polyprotein n=1 Tax=Solanum commersonii TaxID=4109 RepID=A0A9J5X2P0_SOLCO|nr:hypothetical protein H5410_052191 [Solanum commersonii]